jgi:hypothetical protein
MPLLPQGPAHQEPLVWLVIDHENLGHPGLILSLMPL